jgi:hypothetical protein
MSREQPFPVTLLVQIDGFGHPDIHRSDIIARVTREMHLMFGGRAHVTEAKEGPITGGNQSYVPNGEVVPKEVQRLGEVEAVPSVPTQEASAGAGLRSIQDHMLAMRLPFPGPPTEGEST